IPIHGHIAHDDFPFVKPTPLHGKCLRAEPTGYFTRIFYLDGIVGGHIAVDVSEDHKCGGGYVSIDRSRFANDNVTGILNIAYQRAFYPYGPCVFYVSFNNAVATNEGRGRLFSGTFTFLIDQFLCGLEYG